MTLEYEQVPDQGLASKAPFRLRQGIEAGLCQERVHCIGKAERDRTLHKCRLLTPVVKWSDPLNSLFLIPEGDQSGGSVAALGQ